MTNLAWNVQQLSPFGLLVRSDSPGTDLEVVPTSVLQQWIDEHRFIVLKGFAPPAIPDYCRRLGELLEWEFGAVNDLRVDLETKNYLYTNRAVPFHWDGAFVGRVPHYIFFHCEVAPGPDAGGETLFCDTVRLLDEASERVQVWEQVVITYTTEKIVHYGGSFSSPLIAPHPSLGMRVLRYAEPVHDLNPVQLSVKGIDERELIEDMHRRLNDERYCYAYRWESGDVVIADNHALLHGRRAFTDQAERHIRRVNIL